MGGRKEKQISFANERGEKRDEMRVNGQVCRLFFRCDVMDKAHKKATTKTNNFKIFIRLRVTCWNS